jgi:arylsulfatase
MYLRWMADNIWLFVPIQAKVQEFLSTMGDYPFQEGQSLNAAGINYRSLKALQILQQLNQKGVLSPPTN